MPRKMCEFCWLANVSVFPMMTAWQSILFGVFVVNNCAIFLPFYQPESVKRP